MTKEEALALLEEHRPDYIARRTGNGMGDLARNRNSR
jgi:hypothetical protein